LKDGVLKSGRVSTSLRVSFLLIAVIGLAWQAFLHLALSTAKDFGYLQVFWQYLELYPFPVIFYQVEDQGVAKVVFVSAIWYFVWNGIRESGDFG